MKVFSDNLLGTAGAGAVVVSGIRPAYDICQRRIDREQGGGFVRRSIGLALSPRRPAAVEFCSFLPCRRRCVDHVWNRSSTLFFNALGVYVRKRCGGHYFGQHHHFCAAGQLCLDIRTPNRDQSDRRRIGTAAGPRCSASNLAESWSLSRQQQTFNSTQFEHKRAQCFELYRHLGQEAFDFPF